MGRKLHSDHPAGSTASKDVPATMPKQRIELLDSFRCLAILSVLLYHFTDRWIPLFPFGHFFRHLFQFGYLGVQFFFMISGFVISYTLAYTEHFRAFFVNRFSRLFPAMLLCSLLTLVVVRTLDHELLFPYAHKVSNLLPGLSFISPDCWNLLLPRDFFWINGSYWSLWVEVQFYLLASLVYFSDKKNFIRNLLLAGLLVGGLKNIPIAVLHWHLAADQLLPPLMRWKRFSEIFNLSFFIWWFLAGALFFELYQYRLLREKMVVMLSVLALLIFLLEMPLLYSNNFQAQLIAFAGMCILFLLMIYRKTALGFLEHRVLAQIGIISYSMYLIHEDIGVLLIHRYGGLLGRASFLSPFLMILLTIGFSSLSFRLFEKKAGRWLKK